MSARPPQSARVLIVDDEPGICTALKRYLAGEGHETHVAASGEEALKLLLKIEPDVALVDFRLPGVDGLTLLNRIHAIQPEVTIVLMTAFGGVDTAIRATQDGAFAYLPKPLDLVEVGKLVERAITPAPIAVAAAEAPPAGPADWALLGRSEQVQGVVLSVAECAARSAPVLFVGEIGSGREAAARSMFGLAAPTTVPLVHPCANLGIKGFEAACMQTGSPFHLLLELDELEADALDTVMRRTSGGAQRRFAATIGLRPRDDKPTAESIAGFLEAGWAEIRLPALRDRIADLSQLLPALLAIVNRELGRNVRGLDADTLATLEAYSWPGNLRELQNVIRSAVLASPQDVVALDALPKSVHRQRAGNKGVESMTTPKGQS